MKYEEQLLMDLKAEIGARNRRRSARRLAVGAALAGLAAAVTIAVPILTGAERPAYAVTKNPDGTIRVEFEELREPERLEQDLKDLGVNADINFLPRGQSCDPERGKRIHLNPRNPRELLNPSRNGFNLDPRLLGPGRTLLVDIIMMDDWGLAYSHGLIEGPVKPCVLIPLPPGS